MVRLIGAGPVRDGGTLDVYLLFEYKSRPGHWTLLQRLRYIVVAGERHRQQHPQAKRLPPVLLALRSIWSNAPVPAGASCSN